jgi:hypothetical protein
MSLNLFIGLIISAGLIILFLISLIMTRINLTKEVGGSKKKIKCNISGTGKKIYHLPGDKLYEITKIDASKGEMLVDTEHDAIKMGFKRSKFK